LATALLAYLPYLSVGPLRVLGSLPGYASERGIVSGEQFLLLTVVRRLFSAQVPSSAYLVFVCVVLGVLSVWLMQQERGDDVSFMRNGLIVASVFMLLLAPHFSWYFSWLIVFLCFVPSVPVFYLTFASFLLYLTWLGDSSDRVLVLKSLIFAPFLILGVVAIWLRRSE